MSRTLFLVLAVVGFAIACSLFDDGLWARIVKSKVAYLYRLLLFGLSAILFAVWYYLQDRAKSKKKSHPDDLA